MDNNSINVEIMSIGTEILLGNIVNTNSQFISQHLHDIGVNVYHHSVVGDNLDRVISCLENGFINSNVIITTGGLGPTKDDMTKEAVSKYFDEPLVLFPEEEKKLRDFFNKRGITMTENNLRQAYFPKGSQILVNNNGTAPGLILEKNGKTVIMLPGPPNEMTKMFTESVLPYLQKRSNKVFVSKTLNFIGIGESEMESKILDLIKNQENPTIAPYAKFGYPIIRITASGQNKEECENLIKPVEQNILSILGNYFFGTDETTPEEAVVKLLEKQNKTISFAESCTGGKLASTIINVNGSSKVLNESYITYSNEAKKRILGVSDEILEKYGAVSKECAILMAKGVRKISNSDIGVSVTGIAGDYGGTIDKPVGLTYICLSTEFEDKVYKFNFTRERNDNRHFATINALNITIKHLLGVCNEK